MKRLDFCEVALGIDENGCLSPVLRVSAELLSAETLFRLWICDRVHGNARNTIPVHHLIGYRYGCLDSLVVMLSRLLLGWVRPSSVGRTTSIFHQAT